MTAPSSCKRAFFRKYLLYRLGRLKGNLALSCVMSLFALPYFTYGIIGAVENIRQTFYNSGGAVGTAGSQNFLWYLPPLSGTVLVIMSLIGAPLAFNIYNQRTKTDLFGTLPLTHAERFWGDFLGGWIANVAPIIPAGIISVIMTLDIKGSMYDIVHYLDVGDEISCTLFILGVSLSLFAACTVCYIVSAVAAVCCGKLAKSILMSIISAGSLSLASLGISLCLTVVVTGTPFYNNIGAEFTGFFPAFEALRDVLGNYEYLANVDLTKSPLFVNAYSLFEPLYVLYTAAFAAGLTVLAFYLSKARKLEKTGSAFVYTAYFRAVFVVAVAGVFLCVFALNILYEVNFALALGLGLFVGALAAIIMEIIRRPKVRELGKSLVAFALTSVCCIGVYILLDKTGAFGRRFLSAEGVERVEVGFSQSGQEYEVEITDKNDIKTLTDSTNELLKERYGDLKSGYGYTLTYVKSDGSTMTRGFSDRAHVAASELIYRFFNNTCGLSTFPDVLADKIANSIKTQKVTAQFEGVYNELEFSVGKNPEDMERIDEFISIFSEEIREKYSADDAVTGNIVLAGTGSYMQLDIPESCTRTKEYLMSYVEESDDDLVMTVYSTPVIRIFRRDLEKDGVKELISLLKRQDKYHLPDDSSQNIQIQSTDFSSYYVPKNAEQRVTELAFEIARQAVE